MSPRQQRCVSDRPRPEKVEHRHSDSDSDAGSNWFVICSTRDAAALHRARGRDATSGDGDAFGPARKREEVRVPFSKCPGCQARAMVLAHGQIGKPQSVQAARRRAAATISSTRSRLELPSGTQAASVFLPLHCAVCCRNLELNQSKKSLQ